MIAQRLIGKQVGRGAFGIAREVKATEKKFGKDSVINSTLGTFFCEDEKLGVLELVNKTYRELESPDIYGYAAGVSGSAEYKEAVKKSIFGTHCEEIVKNSFVDVASTPGGTGAIYTAFKGYGNDGNTVLLPEYMWDAYVHITGANRLNNVIYKLFDGNKFNTRDFSEKMLEVVKRDGRVLAVINDPCQNPTGYSLSFEEWEEVVEILKEASKYGEVILINDIAYLDYDFRGRDNAREYMNLFLGLPENVLILFAYSMSKSFTSYGLRTGAIVALSSSKKVIDEFTVVAEYLCRSSWSNVSRGGMALLVKAYEDENIINGINAERDQWVEILKKRAEIFERKSEEVGLAYCPFSSGFFLTIPLEKNKEEIVNDLKEKKVFVLPIKNGIRIAICSISCKKLEILPKLIKESIDKFNK
ncbi:pyridoxal phosphate-dependent aminotransferase [Fusobacterium perfoetens]|uniref:pyridoxal phosphate-dependent aminotransferase n=1 Tax=Fusobacterium perfoetens TaxID=852 RepID=UPI00047F30C4|nr:aminotransferase class I/II-fold pyridoxal phosphate-dependent enzyme [Fusobacterium perfoetens]